jgi:hypothetical protein
VDVAVIALPGGDGGNGRLCTTVPDDGSNVVLRDADVSLRLDANGVYVWEAALTLLVEAVRGAFVSRRGPGTGEPGPHSAHLGVKLWRRSTA